MSAQTTRDRILEALKDLPVNATFDDAIERLVFLAKIDEGLAELDARVSRMMRSSVGSAGDPDHLVTAVAP